MAAAVGVGTASPFTYKTRGVFVDLGRFKAVTVFFGVKLHGLPAWLLTRYYHLKRMPGWGRKVRLIADWGTDRLFARDVSELGQFGHRLDQPTPPALEGAAATRFEPGTSP